jgi:hypothetical protein
MARVLPFRAHLALALAAVAVLAGCASEPPGTGPAPRPEEVRAQIVSLLPPTLADRPGWAVDIYAALATLGIEPRPDRICAVLAVTEQESSYRADPTVPRLGQLAREEIDRRAERAGVPKLVVSGALALRSPDTRTWSERIESAKTEKELSDLFEEFIDQVPLGRRLLADYNPVRTGGPMQVSIDFAERHVRSKPYPYRMAGSVRDEVFTRRGGLYFGVAHLLDYPAAYDQMLYRFADFNAGHWASRNAAFQNAVSLLSGVPLELDGDLVVHGGDPAKPGSTELATRTLGARLGLGDGAIRSALERDDEADFEKTRLYARVFELADRLERRPVPRAVVPKIRLHGPKISRALTTEWFARRVDDRYRGCLARAERAERARAAS